MKRNFESSLTSELEKLCTSVRELVADKKYKESISLICQAMEDYPHAPQPHNLLGIVLEKSGDHAGAMKHFRAAWALDPTYSPVKHNLNTYGAFFSGGSCAFDESDVPAPPPSRIKIVYDERGVGHVVSRTEIQYDERGIGHAVRR